LVLSRSQTTKEVLGNSLMLASDVLDADAALVLRSVNVPPSRVIVSATAGDFASLFEDRQFNLSGALATAVDAPIVLNTSEVLQRRPDEFLDTLPEVAGVLLAPMRAGGHFIGILVFGRRTPSVPFTAANRDLAYSLGCL